MTEGPVDFTVKCEEEEQDRKEEMEMNGVQPDMSDMAAFIASATAAVRNAGGNSFQVIPPPNHPHPPQLTPMTNRAQLSAFWSGKKSGGGATEEPITPGLSELLLSC